MFHLRALGRVQIIFDQSLSFSIVEFHMLFPVSIPWIVKHFYVILNVCFFFFFGELSVSIRA